MMTGSEERAAASLSRQDIEVAEAELARALGALHGLPPSARATQRAALESLAGELFPSAAPWVVGLPRWLMLVAAVALILAVARFGHDDGGARRQPSTLPGAVTGEAASPLRDGQPQGGRHGPAATLPAATLGSPVTMLAGSATAGPAVGTVVETPGRVSGKPTVARTGVARVPGPTSTTAPSGPDRTAEVPQAIAPGPASRAPHCRQDALPPLPAGEGPWIVGRIQDEGCRPLAEVLLAFTAVADGTEFLARTETDGSYAVDLDPGTYQAELLVDGPWWAAGGQLDGAGMLARGAADGPLRVDFVVGGGER